VAGGRCARQRGRPDRGGNVARRHAARLTLILRQLSRWAAASYFAEMIKLSKNLRENVLGGNTAVSFAVDKLINVENESAENSMAKPR
ncbi:MAG: hypothetical protein AB7F78_20245, partial [Hyphomicrobiaceae bacterium]